MDCDSNDEDYTPGNKNELKSSDSNIENVSVSHISIFKVLKIHKMLFKTK